jgi:hypothetical protein
VLSKSDVQFAGDAIGKLDILDAWKYCSQIHHHFVDRHLDIVVIVDIDPGDGGKCYCREGDGLLVVENKKGLPLGGALDLVQRSRRQCQITKIRQAL